ncbi:MAG: mannitol dehydrogenase family protein [Propionibacteriaceae bacterium]
MTSLNAETSGSRPSAPVRIVHLGLGNFFRAHQAWYTEHAADAADWGIAAFTGRRPDIADALAPQDGRFTLITKGPAGNGYEVISSVVAVHPASDHAAFLNYLRDPAVAVVTLTVTEFGYARATDGHLDTDRVSGDIAALQGSSEAAVASAPAKLVAGLLARRAAGAGKITIVSCDNVPENGSAVRTVVLDLAALVDADLGTWIDSEVTFATSMVDRITPATTDEDVAAVRQAQGYIDAAPVPTEPFSEWVISADFAAGAPDWGSAGAQIVDDVRPYEERKLWMLNGAHSLLAYAGSLLGHQTVDQAIGDERCRAWVADWWDVAGPQLSLSPAEVDDSRTALLDRWSNPSIGHLLAQIANDGSQKLRARTVPVLKTELGQGRCPAGAVRPVAAWTLHLRGRGAPVKDAGGETVVRAAGGPIDEAVPRVIALLDQELAGNAMVVEAVRAQVTELEALS